MFLTRFLINRTRPATQKMLGSPYCLHAAVAGSFPTEEPSHKASIRPLWRLDIEPTGSAWLYIVSQTEPSLVGLDEQIGFPDQPPTWQTRHYDPFLNSLNEGQLWSFRLVANPVRAVRKQPRSSDERGKRLGHTTATQQLAWLIGQAAYPPDSDSEIRKQFPPPVKSKAASNGFAIPIDESDCPRVMVSNRHTHQLSRSVIQRTASPFPQSVSTGFYVSLTPNYSVQP